MKTSPIPPLSSGKPCRPRAGTLVISLDFELYWGIFDVHSLPACRQRLLAAREAIPKILDLFEGYDVCATWATVGFLMCESREELFELMPDLRPAYDDGRLRSYDQVRHMGRSEDDDPFHFAPSIVEHIAARPGQEIATHTFSHYYCLEPGQTLAAFTADLKAAIKVARRRGHRLRSIVFPRNQFNEAYLDVCRRQGIWAVRGNPVTPWHRSADHHSYNSMFRKAGRFLDAYLPLNPTRRLDGAERARTLPVNVPATRFLRPYNPLLDRVEHWRVRRIKNELTLAAREGGLCHLWWHPHNFGTHTERNLEILEELLQHFDELRRTYAMQTCTMKALARELGSGLQQKPSGSVQDSAMEISR
jgi:peptidoglycan/xylan/chitin deacetylase (PgdA/CDA1 family)